MSLQITEAFVEEFSSNVVMLSQQKGSRLRAAVKNDSIKGKSKAYDRIGAVDMVEKTGRHTNTPQLDTPHSRRWLFLRDFEWADLIDDLDKVRLLNDPESEYMLAAMWAAGRTMDTRIIAAADASVLTGENPGDGANATHPNSQKVAANDGTNLTNLNVGTLIQMKSKFGQADVDESIPLHIAVTQRQLDSLLADDQVASSDYNTVKALVKGEVDTYMGFKFHRTQRLQNQSGSLSANASSGAVGSGGGDVNGYRKIIAWAESGLVLGIGQDVKARITERDDKSYATQPYINMAIGALRLEEEQVVIGFCNEG